MFIRRLWHLQCYLTSVSFRRMYHVLTLYRILRRNVNATTQWTDQRDLSLAAADFR